ncbi:unnamed protein product [Anisakis simplex]|uniref:Peptidase M13 C-terminal domain-containing protein n=1 Tax=Anisakis simplex TaxID=6269 RepID=A0A3P6U2S4_ANISI|nr:unnamed protein product [Anisakis simplex]
MSSSVIFNTVISARACCRAVNYGSIGSVIGHEITHGFDDQGSQFDKDGNLLDWWDQATKEQFNKRTGCIVEQYSKFSLPGTDVHVNGLLTQGENIADNGGVKEAYKAYKNRVKKSRKDEKRLPGLEKYTNDQIFFMSFAQSWCGKSKPAAARELILTDPHSPPQFRVEGAAVNQPEFAEAFQCASGTAMNPVTKCDVW